MELLTIGEVSRQFGVSTRTLRYYEQIGLIRPSKREDFSYRTYERDTLLRLKQIIFLRKLRVPLKSIAEILLTENTALLMEVFRQSLREMDDEITALTTIKGVIASFLDRLRLPSARLQLLDDESLLEIVDSLTASKINFKEEKTMEDLNRAGEKLSKLTDRDVRIIYLPPAEVAAYQYEGDGPEGIVGPVIDKFVLDSDLTKRKPDLRHYGFNSPNPEMSDPTGKHGYEMWVTIPDTMDVPAPLVKKRFDGGLYAAHMIPMGAFEEWPWLNQWLQGSDKYEYRGDWNEANMFGWLEEQLNYLNRVHLPDAEGEGCQLDLLIPIREKRKD